MTPEDWYVRLEAYLDGELEPAAAQAFLAETRDDPDRAAGLERRLAFRTLTREALGDAAPSSWPALPPVPRRRRLMRRESGWAVLAVAAILATVMVLPRLTTHPEGQSRLGARPGGQGVVAPRWGERDGSVHQLEASRLDLPAGFLDLEVQ
jgi:anti-sigma factor RsiW